MPKPSPNKRNDNAKRARQNSPREEHQHGGQEDVLYLELFDLIRTLQAKDETKEEQLRILQMQLDQALAEIKSLHTIVEAFKESLEYTQKQQEDANESVSSFRWGLWLGNNQAFVPFMASSIVWRKGFLLSARQRLGITDA